MKALIFDNRLYFSNTYPVPLLKENQALIKIRMAGICATDMEILKGYRGFKGVPGHEFVGIVEKIKGEKQTLLGRRVAGEINCVCGKCGYCRKGLKNHCSRRTVPGIAGRDGVFAEYLTLPLENLHEVPANLADEEAVFTEPLAAAFEILEQVRVKGDDRILILGDGKLGILCSLVLRRVSSSILLAGKHPEKLDIVKKQNIAWTLIDKLHLRKEYDIVVDATGAPEGLQKALEFVKPRGTVVMKTTVEKSASMNLSSIVINEINVVGSRCGPFEPAIRALADGEIDVKPLITEIIPFSKWKRAFARARDRDSLKVILDMREKGEINA